MSASPDRTADHDWWRDAVVYQVYPRSFADSDGDGVGDLPGIVSRLPYLAELGVDAVWLSPFYVSPQRDGGYDIADYRDVDPLFGSLADADRLVEEAHRLGLRVIVDLVPNHTSSDHPWFLAALAAPPGSLQRARYIFRDGRGPDGALPPNDWESVFGGPAWTRVPDGTDTGTAPSRAADGGGQWYLHLFDVGQPDLNWSDPTVAAEFESILRFWSDRGVDGFRVDVANGLVKAGGLPNWVGGHNPLTIDESRGRPPMWDQDGVHEIFRSWRRVLDGYPHRPVLVAEAWVRPAERQARYVRSDEMHQAFNFEYVLTPWHAARQRRIIDAVLAANAAVGAPATWVLSNHDVVRHPTRFAYPPEGPRPSGIGVDDEQPDHTLGLRRGLAATLLMLALPGAAYLYQGEELGLPEHTTLPDDARQDPTWFRSEGRERGRDGARVPLPWTADAPSLGFGPGPATWLPQPEEWAALAVDRQTGDPRSTLELYRVALRLRRELSLGSGTLTWQDIPPGTGAVRAEATEAADATKAAEATPAATGRDGVPEAAAGVLAFRNGATLVLANLGLPPVPVPPGAEVLLSSGDLLTVTDDPAGANVPVGRDTPAGSGTAGSLAVPADTTVWLALPEG
ncbi:MAG: glycoside hydrolase family 13 protein [Actinomycetales bacterium]|nr:glycoside hydrolase family 13 protein [Actinomycetales bacterium]